MNSVDSSPEVLRALLYIWPGMSFIVQWLQGHLYKQAEMSKQKTMFTGIQILIYFYWERIQDKKNKVRKCSLFGLLVIIFRCLGNYALKLPSKCINMRIILAQRIKRNKRM